MTTSQSVAARGRALVRSFLLCAVATTALLACDAAADRVAGSNAAGPQSSAPPTKVADARLAVNSCNVDLYVAGVRSSSKEVRLDRAPAKAVKSDKGAATSGGTSRLFYARRDPVTKKQTMRVLCVTDGTAAARDEVVRRFTTGGPGLFKAPSAPRPGNIGGGGGRDEGAASKGAPASASPAPAAFLSDDECTIVIGEDGTCFGWPCYVDYHAEVGNWEHVAYSCSGACEQQPLYWVDRVEDNYGNVSWIEWSWFGDLAECDVVEDGGYREEEEPWDGWRNSRNPGPPTPPSLDPYPALFDSLQTYTFHVSNLPRPIGWTVDGVTVCGATVYCSITLTSSTAEILVRGTWGSYGDFEAQPVINLAPGAPPGWELSEWNKLSPGEKNLVLYDDPPKWFNRREEMRAMAQSAIDESLRLTGATKDDDGTKQNAIQHALWAGKMAMAYGHADALKWTTAHEDRPVPLGVSVTLFNEHKTMDLHNNALGLGYFWNPVGTIEEYVMRNQGQLCFIEGAGGRICF